jgi:transmembrane sensor
MDHRDDIDALTLARYLSGELGATEAAEVERWIAADPAHRELIDALRKVWSLRALPDFDPDDVLWRRIAAGVERPLRKPALVSSRQTPAWPFRSPARLLTAAAAAVVVLVGGVALVARLRKPIGPEPMREVATRLGQRAALDLPDGSRVVLAPGSRVRIPAGYSVHGSGSSRELFLEGQAFFAVRHDSTRPFRVHTATALVEDIGTEFVVTSQSEFHGTQVVVVSGAVALRQTSAPAAPPLLTLTRGDLARLDSSGIAVVTRDVNLAPYVAWTDGNLVFDGTPLREVAPALARWYDLDVRVTDSALASRKFTASFRNEPISQVLEVVARSLDVRVERRGTSVVLSPNRHQPARADSQ